MNVNDLLNVGNGILNDVTRAVESGNFEGLGERTKERVNYAATQFSSPQNQRRGGQPQYQQRPGQPGQPYQQRPGQQGQPYRQGPYQQRGAQPQYQQRPGQPGQPYQQMPPQGAYQQRIQRTNETLQRQAQGYQPYNYASRKPRTFFLSRPQSSSTGIAQIVLGSIGSFIGFIGSLSSLGTIAAAGGLGAAAGIGAAGTALVFAAVFFMSLGLIRSGLKNKKLIKDYYEYGAAVGNAEYFNIETIAAKVGVSAKEFTKKIELMIKKNLLPGAKLDRQKTTVMLTDRAYEQYKQAENSRIEREAAQQMRGEPVVKVEDQTDSEVKRIIEDGNRAIQHVRAINDEIPDTMIMSDKLYRLEDIMRRIFEQVQKDPSTADDLRRFMDYYLPTTTKLLSAYVELDKQPLQGENIQKTKKEIESSLDTINDAFEQLLDDMFSDMAMDISTDISVMKTMMAQDGLAQDENGFPGGPVELKF